MRRATVDSLHRARSVWAAPKRVAPSTWMQSEYVISAEESAEPGRYSFGRYAYLRDVVDWLIDPDVEMVVLPKAAQTGYTAAITGFVGSLVDNDPCRILVAMPTQDEAEVWSKDRLEPNLAASPALRGKIAPAKSRDGNNKILHKRFPGGSLKVVGANSATGLSSWPAKFAFADEVDRYPLSAGGEGDPIALLRKRLQTWLSRGGKLCLGSTPKIEQTSLIWHYHSLGDQRRWLVPCGNCGERHAMEWVNLRWQEGRPETAGYVCPDCGATWSDLDRLVAVSKGEWRATATARDARIRSAWIDGFLSPHVTHAEMATKWLACGSDEQRQAFVNLYLGRPWQLRGESPEWQRLYDRREDWPGNLLPAGAVFLTAGVDVQKDRIEARVWAWGRGQQSWLADVRVIPGDLARDEIWAQLDTVLNGTWSHVSGADLSLSLLAIDSGHATSEVYRWARAHGRRVMVVKGMPDHFRKAIGLPSSQEVAGLKRSIAGVKVTPVGTGFVKGLFYSRLRKDAPIDGAAFPDGYVHLPRWVGDDEIKQMTAEELVVEKTKQGFQRTVWHRLRPNEALDCWVYAYAAAIRLGMDRFTDATWRKYEAVVAVETKADEVPPVAQNRPSGSPFRVIPSGYLG